MRIVTFTGFEPDAYPRGADHIGWAIARYNQRSGELAVAASTAKQAVEVIKPIANTVLKGVAILAGIKGVTEIGKALLAQPRPKAAKNCRRR